MKAVVTAIIPDSPASRTIITSGDVLHKINGHVIHDVLDYKFHSYDTRLLLEFTGVGGKLKLIRINKPEGTDIGLEFDSDLMDRARSCANKCIFCFIDQLPDGMRETMYYKDDDVRLSFLHGNYVTLTNLSTDEAERMARLRVSPINVSVHTLDPALRAYMFGIKDGRRGLNALTVFARAGIELNCQIVCCPDVNDGQELTKTMKGLLRLGHTLNSVSIVPVGLTKHRDYLTPLRTFDKTASEATVRQVEDFASDCLKKLGKRIFFCADEFYINAGIELPSHEYYEGYPQLENGVGMMRLFIQEFLNELAGTKKTPGDTSFSIATGAAAYSQLTNLLQVVTDKYDRIDCKIHLIRNDYFGESVTVSGLVTGSDLIAQLKGRDLGDRLLIPRNMLRWGEDVFLDGVTVGQLSDVLMLPVKAVSQDGGQLLQVMFE